MKSLLVPGVVVAVFIIGLCVTHPGAAVEPSENEGWLPLFDGKTLNGWKANESPDTWSVEDGAIVAKGPVSHLYYVGPSGDANRGDATFGDFDLKAEVRLGRNTNSGIFFRTPWQDSGWLKKGLEAQMQNDGQNTCYTGGLWIHANLVQPPGIAPDEWFQVEIHAHGPKITVKINGEIKTEYNLDEEQRKGLKANTPGEGFLVLQGHGPKHRPAFRNITIRPAAPAADTAAPPAR